MKLRKSLVIMYGTALLSGSIVSCSSSDDFTSQLEVEDKVAATGIESEINGLFTTIKIKSNDSWTIEVPKEDRKWIAIPVKSGQGDKEVAVSIGANFKSTVGRSSTITIKTGTQEQTIKVTQTPTYQGQNVVTNGEIDNYVEISDSKKLGYGYDPNTGRTTDPIINTNVFTVLMKEQPTKFKNLFKYDPAAKAEVEGRITDSVETKTDTLGARMTFNVNYSGFRLGISGRYVGDEKNEHSMNQYNYSASFRAGTAEVQAGTAAYYFKRAYNKKQEDSNEYNLVTPAILSALEDMQSDLANKDTAKVYSTIEDFITQYGTQVTTRCVLGGNIAVSMRYDRDSVGGLMGVDSAKLTVGYESFLSGTPGSLKVNGEAEVTYKKFAQTVMENSYYKYEIEGGSSQGMNDLTTAMTKLRTQGDKDEVYENVQKKISDWVATINGKDAGTIVPIKYEMTPIWNFFPSPYAGLIRDWVKKNIKNDKLGLISNPEVQKDLNKKD